MAMCSVKFPSLLNERVSLKSFLPPTPQFRSYLIRLPHLSYFLDFDLNISSFSSRQMLIKSILFDDLQLLVP